MGPAADSVLYRLLKPHFRGLSLGVVAIFLEGLANMAEPWPLKIVLDNVFKSRPAGGWLGALAGSNRPLILDIAAGGVLVIAVVGAICTYMEKRVSARASQYLMHDLRQMLYSHIQRLSLDYHDRSRTGELVGCLTSDVDAIQSFIASGLLGSLANALTLLGMVVLMISVNWRFTLVALSVAPFLFGIIFSYTRRIKRASREVRRKEGEMASLIQESLSLNRVVKAFAGESHEERRLETESLEAVGIASRVHGLKMKFAPLVDMVVAIGTALVLWLGGRMVLRGVLSTGSLVLFIWYLGRMYKPMKELSKMTDVYSRAAAGYERISEILGTERKVRDLPGARPVSSIRGEIRFDEVTFGYDPRRPVLKQVSLTVFPGQLAALVGPTGAGKSTLINLIARFYDPDAGTVKIDRTDVKLWQQESLRRQISFVLQDTVLFRESLWYNIAYGRSGASHADILRAAKLSNADDFISRMPRGYDTIVGERGLTLSGGQRQLIAITRAIIRDAPILILDEATSGLDASSEEKVVGGLKCLMHGRTSIVIAHKLATVRSADVIFVLQSGTIVESGRHDELVAGNGLYRALHDSQFHAANVPACEASG
jgi:subfamily B ATP-binding cassette protein MsbA